MIDPHEREVTGIDWSKPAHEPRKLSHLQPGWDEIPEEHRYSPICHPLAAYSSGQAKVKEGINEEDAINHLKEISSSWRYANEHKQAALAYLGFLWLDYASPEDMSVSHCKRPGCDEPSKKGEDLCGDCLWEAIEQAP